MTDFQEKSFEELEREFKRKYQVFERAGQPSEVLGEGTYGKVYKARCAGTGKVVAIKESKDSNVEGVPPTAIREIALVQHLNHRNVVKLLDVFCSPTKLLLVFECLEHDLKKYMKSVGRAQEPHKHSLEPSVIQGLSFQLVEGIQFCHGHRVLHRDLKPQNLLISSEHGELVLQIADFGLARSYNIPVGKYTHEVVTVWYRCPEILLGCTHYSAPVDMWSTGCIMAEMATGSPLFMGDSEIDTIFKIFLKLGTPSLEEWPGLKDLPQWKPVFPNWPRKVWQSIRNVKDQMNSEGMDLLDKLLAYDPKIRLSGKAALEHPYFASDVRVRR